MVLQFITPDLDAACLIYNDMMFKVALGIDQKRHVRLRLDKLAVKQSWSFCVRSFPTTGSTSHFTKHACGTISLLPSIDLGLFRRLISNDFRQLKGKADVETLRSGPAYRLFSKVVDYGSFFHGKLNITMDDGQAFANIKIP